MNYNMQKEIPISWRQMGIGFTWQKGVNIQVKMAPLGYDPKTYTLKECCSTEIELRNQKERGYVLPVMETSYPEHNSHFTLKISFRTKRRFLFCLTSFIAPERLELSRVAPTDFKSVASANYAKVPNQLTALLYHHKQPMQEQSIQLFFFDKKIKG